MAHALGKYKRVVALVVIFLALFFCKINFLFAYSQNFDSLTDGYNIGEYDGWYGSGKIQSSYYVSSPLGLDINYSGSATYSRYVATTSEWSFFSFNWYYDEITTGDDFYFRVYDTATTSQNYFIPIILRMKPNRAGSDAVLGIASGISFSTSTVVKEILSLDTWYKIDIEYDKTLGRSRARIDDSDWSSWVFITDMTWTYSDSAYWSINTQTTSKVYIDDVYISTSPPPPSVDYLAFNTPFYGADYSVYDFYWKLLYQLSTTTIATYSDEKLGLTVEWKNTDTGVIGLPTTTGIAEISSLNLSEFLPDTIASYSWDNRIYVPTQLGTYIATATMWHYEDIDNSGIIMTATTTWTMSTGTPESVDSGWCKNLCWDIATSTTFLDSLTNSIVCGGRYVMCYTFQPHDSVVYMVGDSIEKMKDSFPFNSYFGLTDTVKEVIATTTIDSDATIGVPMIRKTGTTSEYYIMPLLGSTTMQSTIGATNAETVKTTLGWLAWVIVAGIIIVVIS